MRKSIISTVALASLAGVALVYSAEPAAAKSACQAKFNSCNSRGFAKYDDPFPCIHRTCDRQFDNCVATGGGKTGPMVRDKHRTG